MRTNEQILKAKKERLAQIESKGRSVKSPGVIKRLQREIRNMEGQMNE